MKWVMDALKGDSAYERIPHILGASLQDVEVNGGRGRGKGGRGEGGKGEGGLFG